MNDKPFQINQRLQRKLGEVDAICEAMKGTIHIGSGISDQFNLADAELCSTGIMFTGFFPRKKVTDDRRGETLVCDHPMFHFMAKVDQFAIHNSLLVLICRCEEWCVAPRRSN